MGTPIPLTEVAESYRVTPRTVWEWVRKFGLTRYHMPGKGKTTYLDPDEVRRKLRPQVYKPKPRPTESAEPDA